MVWTRVSQNAFRWIPGLLRDPDGRVPQKTTPPSNQFWRSSILRFRSKGKGPSELGQRGLTQTATVTYFQLAAIRLNFLGINRFSRNAATNIDAETNWRLHAIYGLSQTSKDCAELGPFSFRNILTGPDPSWERGGSRVRGYTNPRRTKCAGEVYWSFFLLWNVLPLLAMHTSSHWL